MVTSRKRKKPNTENILAVTLVFSVLEIRIKVFPTYSSSSHHVPGTVALRDAAVTNRKRVSSTTGLRCWGDGVINDISDEACNSIVMSSVTKNKSTLRSWREAESREASRKRCWVWLSKRRLSRHWRSESGPGKKEPRVLEKLKSVWPVGRK